MKKNYINIKLCLITLILILGSQNVFSQLSIIESTYTSWEGITYDTYLIESNYTVIHIDKNEVEPGQIDDIETMTKIVNRVDRIYGFYTINLGYEPPGGNPNYSNKADVFFGPPSCGAGCGKIGAKGVEVGLSFQGLFYNLKYNTNVNTDVIIGWEMGRNFFTFGSKILFPYAPNTDDKNGGFAEAFASIMYLYAFDEIMDNEEQRTLNETLMNIKWNLQIFHGYINDTTANPYNSWAKWEKSGTQDPNRGIDGFNYDIAPSYHSAGFLTGMFETFGKENLFPNFFRELRNRPDAVTIEDALSNIAYSASKSLNKNLVPFFKNVMRFNLNPEVEQEINSFPPVESKLIRDEQLLWFLSPHEKINLNLRSTNYLQDGMTYKLIIDGEEYSSSLNGNNVLNYNILKGKNEKIVTCELLDNDQTIDTFNILVKKRHNINPFDYKEDFYAFYLSNKKVKTYFEGDELVIKHLDTLNYDSGVVYYNIMFSRDRNIQLSGEIKQDARTFELEMFGPEWPYYNISGISRLFLSGPGGQIGGTQVGGEIGTGDNINYYHIEATGLTNTMMPEGRSYFMNRVSFTNGGYIKKTNYRNVILKDITDTDNDGIVDFEDNCFEIYNPDQSDLDSDGLGDVCDDDIDGDGILNVDDNCPMIFNPGQEDIDIDGIGDVCDDDDGDGVMNNIDTCPNTLIGQSVNATGCSQSQLDDDNDGVMNDKDLCPNTTAGTEVNGNGCFFLPSNNFTIESKSETCPDKKNGQILITANKSHSYTATINNASHNFTNNSLTVSNLAPGTYDVCITVSEDASFKQCYSIVIEIGKTVSGKASVTLNKVSIEIDKGTPPYAVFRNGKEVFETINPSFSVDILHGDFIEVKTANTCEGTFSKAIDLFEGLVAYPNPTTGKFEIGVPILRKEVVVELYTINSQLISKGTYPVIYGKVELSLENQAPAVYLVKVYLETPMTIKIIKQ
ncbi:MAG TPA: thrombospondin type 3 repeat-containing protein [Lutibacter sp.]